MLLLAGIGATFYVHNATVLNSLLRKTIGKYIWLDKVNIGTSVSAAGSAPSSLVLK